MTVKELIQALQALPEDTIVCWGYHRGHAEATLENFYVDDRTPPIELISEGDEWERNWDGYNRPTLGEFLKVKD